MTTRDNSPDPIERQLQAQLKETTPEFEARFDALRRRLATDEQPRRRSWFVPAFSLAGAGLAAVLAVIVWVRFSPDTEDTPAGLASFSELLELDASLREALVLFDPETRESIANLPLEEEMKS